MCIRSLTDFPAKDHQLSITLETLISHREEAEKKFGKNETLAFANVSRTQLSIARHYGGCKVQGKQFVYNWQDDSLIREDVVKWMAKRIKDEAKAAKTESVSPSTSASESATPLLE